MPLIGPIRRWITLFIAVFTTCSSLLAQPVITSFSPKQATQGQTVLIFGRQLSGTSAVRFGSEPCASFTILSDTAVNAVVGNGASGGVGIITPSGTDTLPGFTYLLSLYPPAPYSYSPHSGTTGDTITIGAYYSNGLQGVSFGGVPAAGFWQVNDSVIKAIVGTGATGDVVVSNQMGNGSLAGFTFVPLSATQHITLSSFSPARGRTNDSIFIKGRNLTGATTVTFGHVAARSFYIFSDSLMAAVVGLGASGNVSVQGVRGLDSLPGFTYIDTTREPPVVTPPVDSVPPVVVPPVPHVFQLLQFSGVDTGNVTALVWRTVYDVNQLFYFILSGPDSSHLTPIHTVNSVRDTAGATYAYTLFGKAGTVFYQLQIEDSAAHYIYSPIIAVSGPPVVGNISTYPNPATDKATILVPPTTLTSVFQLTDLSGNILRTIAVPAGTIQVAIPLTGLIKGIYKLGWSDGTHKSATTIMVVK